MFEKNVLLEVSKDKIKNTQIKRGIFTYKKNAYTKSQIVDLENLSVNIKNKKVYMIVEGEEIYIKLITIPKVDKCKINAIIKNKLRFLYGEKANNVFYSYVIRNKKNKEIEVIVFCVNFSNLNCLDKFMKNNTIKNINLIQFCFLNYFQKSISEKNYVFIFMYNSRIYFLGVIDGDLVANKILDFRYSNGFNDTLKYVLSRMDKYNVEISKIYSVNLNNKNIFDNFNIEIDYEHINFGEIKNEKIRNYFTI